MARQRDSRGRFLKRGGGSRRRRSTALVHVPRTVTRTRSRTRYVKVRSRRRRSSGGMFGGPILPIVAAGAALGYVDAKTTALQVLDKIPGTKTIGRPAMTGLAALAINRYVFRNRWLRVIGIGGLLVGAFQWGAKGFALEWVGDTIDVDD